MPYYEEYSSYSSETDYEDDARPRRRRSRRPRSKHLVTAPPAVGQHHRSHSRSRVFGGGRDRQPDININIEESIHTGEGRRSGGPPVPPAPTMPGGFPGVVSQPQPPPAADADYMRWKAEEARRAAEREARRMQERQDEEVREREAAYIRHKRHEKEEEDSAIRRYREQREREEQEKRRAIDEFRLAREREEHMKAEEFKAREAKKKEDEAREKKEKEEAVRKAKADEAAKAAADKKAKEEAVEKWQAEQKSKEEKAKKEKEEAVAKWQIEQKEKEEKKKKEQEEAIARWKQEQKEKEEKEKAAWEAYEAKRKQKELEEKEKKEKEEREYKERMRADLLKAGMRERDIEAVLEGKEKKMITSGRERISSSTSTTITRIGSRPVFPKIKRQDIAIETLRFYDLEWEYDRSDPDYIIILHEMNERETDMLFEHTRRIRSKTTTTLAIEERKSRGEKPQFMMVRRRSKSARGKSPSRREKLAEALLR